MEPNRFARVAGAVTHHPREFVAIVMATAAVVTIFANALFMQHGPHPAPIFATRPATAVAPHTQLIGDIQRALAAKGFYDGPADGLWGAKTDVAVRDFLRVSGLKIRAEADDALLRAIMASNLHAPAQDSPRNDPIAQLLAPSKRLLAVQNALSDFGYGQIKPTGIYDADTKAAIEKFERDRRLPVTGQISDTLVRELAAMTGRPLE